jgi:hypothetical protein
MTELQKGTRVLAKFTDGAFYPGKVYRMLDDDMVRVFFDDGDRLSVRRRDVLAEVTATKYQKLVSRLEEAKEEIAHLKNLSDHLEEVEEELAKAREKMRAMRHELSLRQPLNSAGAPVPGGTGVHEAEVAIRHPGAIVVHSRD